MHHEHDLEGRVTDTIVAIDLPWDDEPRRPSHADERRAWRRELPAEEIHAVLRARSSAEELRLAAERLLDLAA